MSADAPVSTEGRHHRASPWASMLGARGVVYGDIGTSPLYAMKERFSAESPHHVTATADNVLGILSSPRPRDPVSRWRKALFAFASRNARPATAYFGLPPNRVVELGMQIDL